MRFATWNVNGLRAALKKGLERHLEALNPDVLMLQEIRATPAQLPPEWRAREDWKIAWNPAIRPGYAGTAVWSRAPLWPLFNGLGGEEDPEGRIVAVEVAGVWVVSVYLPSGSASPAAQAKKDAWMQRFLPWTEQLYARPEPVVLGGDLNIAHTPLDIHNPKGNAKNSGFLPHERAWFDDLLAVGWRDLVREHVGQAQGPYSWWSNRGQARALDRGWRIDYMLGNNAFAQRVRAAGVVREGGLEVSDHAPVWVDLEDR